MTDPAAAPGERLPRHLGLWSSVAVLVGITIGSGIFRVPAGIAATLGSPGPVMFAWVVGGVIALTGALTVAELAAALPRSGGLFAYIHEAFGPLPAFLMGWSELAVLRASALGAISTIFAEYLGYFIHLEPTTVRRVAAGMVIVVGLINYIGINTASVVMNLTTVAKYGALSLLVLLAFLAGDGHAANLVPTWGTTATTSLLFTALVSIMWTYDGWADLSFAGGEVKDPGRTLPRALIIGTSLIVLIYLSINAAFLYLVPVEEMRGAKLIASTAAERIPLLGGRGGAIIAGVVMLSAFGSLNGSMLTGARIFFAMADQGLFFTSIARVSPRFKTPSVSILLCTVLGVVYVLLNDFQQLADKFVLGIWPFYALAVLAVFVLRRTQPDLPRPYLTVGYPVVPIVFLLASVAMVVNALVTSPADTGFTFGILALGVPVYYARQRWLKAS
jgi:amino acid transporter